MELSEGMKWIIGIVLVLVVLGITGLNCQRQDTARHVQMAEKGYKQVMVVGHTTPVWQPACACSSGVRP